MKQSTIESLVQDFLASLEKDEDNNYLISVFVPQLGTYEWFPVNEEVAELLYLMEREIHGEKKRRSRRLTERY